MNKQEVIDKLKEHGAWCTECHDTNGEKDRYVKVAKVRELLEKLDEPQKVKVPAFVAPFIDKLKTTNRRYGFELERTYESSEDNDLRKWIGFNENVLTVFKALENGYEVEEEPKWVVIVGNFYLKEPLGDTNIDTVQMSQQKKSAYKFDDKETALLHAKWIGENIAIVEKV